MLVAISTAIPLLVAGVLIVWMAARSASGTLARNSWVGIRTAATLRGDDEWRTGHAAAVVPMYAGGIGLIAAAAAAVFVGEDGAVWAAMIGCAWVVVCLLIAAVVAGRAIARRDTDHPAP